MPQVEAAGVNRLDLLQVLGRYPPPPGDSEVLGVEGVWLQRERLAHCFVSCITVEYKVTGGH